MSDDLLHPELVVDERGRARWHAGGASAPTLTELSVKLGGARFRDHYPLGSGGFRHDWGPQHVADRRRADLAAAMSAREHPEFRHRTPAPRSELPSQNELDRAAVESETAAQSVRQRRAIAREARRGRPRVKLTERQDQVLDLWFRGLKAIDITYEMPGMTMHDVNNAVAKARGLGDRRAERRHQGHGVIAA